MTTELIECCICYETIGDKNNCVTPCGHKFCFVCLTKSLTTNNTCPCCREVLIEAPEEEDDDSDYDSGSDSEMGVPIEDIINIQDVTLEDINDNADIMYEKMIKRGVTTKEIMQLLISYYLGQYRDDLTEQVREVDDKIEDSLHHAFGNTIRENIIKNEQMMFLREDKIENINALDMIALNY